ncbi:Retinaldehyde-binding protein 1, partial [Orchesella cincta]
MMEIRRLISEFLSSEKGSAKVREYISTVAHDDKRILIYLKGRKYRAAYAWETLKRYAEVRFDEYPELFPDESQHIGLQIKNCGILNMLKSRDKFGRRIAFLNGGKVGY